MSGSFRAVRVSERVWWVGAIDWSLRDFHGYRTGRGSSYNAYLVMGEKIALLDTVKAPFWDEMRARIASVIEPERIDVIVCNHAELDHAGCLPQAIEAFRPERVLASKRGVPALKEYFHWDQEVEAVGSGDRIDLGGDALGFIETPMLHWPDSMITWLEGERILFPNDAFGAHLASSERFADEIDPAALRYETAKYYANILLHLSPIVQRSLAKLGELDLDIRMIAPDHGPIWRENPLRIVEQYGEWAAQAPTRKAVLAYDTMWLSTAKMAHAVADGLAEGGASVKLLPLSTEHRSDVVTELLDAGALLVGSPTMNNQIHPNVADVMTYLAGLKPKNLVGAAFGSYGWSGEAVRNLDRALTDMGVELVREGLRVKYAPDEEQLAECHALGLEVAARLPA